MRALTKERTLRWLLPFAAAALIAPLPQAAAAKDAAVSATFSAPLKREINARSGDLHAFYAARSYEPLWLDTAGKPTEAATALLDRLRTAQLDNVDPARFQLTQLGKTLDKARRGNDAGNKADAELALSRAFVAYVQAMRGSNHQDMTYESIDVQPYVPTARAVLEGAGKSGAAKDYLAAMGWMHPLYAPLRAAAADPRYTDGQHKLIEANLARLRAIPGGLAGRYVLVDAASATLWMYEGGTPVDSMKVVVGKTEMPTPMMAGMIRTAIVNPYWQVPDDLVQTSIAPNVLEKGVKYLRGGGYQVLASWDDNAPLVNPGRVDWQAVRSGLSKVHVRQLPGGANFMGRVKFEFPNPLGIYLHDTPAKDLMAQDARQFSSGCVRLEDAPRLGRWLMGGTLPTSKKPETKVALPQPVPVYITYLTAFPEADGQVAFRSDPYKRDSSTQLALADNGGAASH
jgi:murein L,D-transpeptidase YcbB/YkuD